jgi:hypothetical protein
MDEYIDIGLGRVCVSFAYVTCESLLDGDPAFANDTACAGALATTPTTPNSSTTSLTVRVRLAPLDADADAFRPLLSRLRVLPPDPTETAVVDPESTLILLNSSLAALTYISFSLSVASGLGK